MTERPRTRPEHQAVPRRYGLACYCGARFDDTHALEDHLHDAQADLLARRMAQRMVAAYAPRDQPYRPSIGVLAVWIGVIAVLIMFVRLSM
jgi:hypothetical protein